MNNNLVVRKTDQLNIDTPQEFDSLLAEGMVSIHSPLTIRTLGTFNMPVTALADITQTGRTIYGALVFREGVTSKANIKTAGRLISYGDIIVKGTLDVGTQLFLPVGKRLVVFGEPTTRYFSGTLGNMRVIITDTRIRTDMYNDYKHTYTHRVEDFPTAELGWDGNRWRETIISIYNNLPSLQGVS